MARVIRKGRPAARITPTLWFNYATPITSPWMQPALAERYRFRVAAPAKGSAGVSIRVAD